jgi:protoporphyrin/coproporphyrin ferrochelatase
LGIDDGKFAKAGINSTALPRGRPRPARRTSPATVRRDVARRLLNAKATMPPPSPELVLVTNLGTPRAATAEDVREFLREFLSDRQVVDYPAFLWQPLLERIILRSRPGRVAEMYQSVVADAAGMPLAVGTEAIAHALAKSLGAGFEARTAYRYGVPSVTALVATALQAGRNATVVPLFPQRTSSSSETIVDAVAETARSANGDGYAQVARIAPDDPGYVDALADRVRAAGGFRHLVISFHGIPRRYDRREGGRYRTDCEITARALTAALRIPARDATLSFQSRFGPEPWLGPATFDTLRSLARRGVRDVAVVMPGFLTEGLETLEEIGVRGRETFVAAGGSGFSRVASVCDHPAFIASLAARIRDARRADSGETTAHAC